MNDHFANFSDHRHSCSKDKVVFVYQVTSKNYMIKVLNGFTARSLSRYLTILTSLLVLGTVAVEM